MSHIPNPVDVSTDLLRCFYSSLSEKGFESQNYKIFIKHAIDIFPKVEHQIKPDIKKIILMRLEKAQNPNNPKRKRQEDLLTASTLLQNSFTISS